MSLPSLHVDEIAKWPEEEQLAFFSAMSPEELLRYKYEWRYHARANQLLPEHGWNLGLILAGRGYGKSLDLKTLIPTPSGFKKLEEISVGDSVFDENGAICKVTKLFDIFTPETAYRLKFSDGSYIDSCSEHQWVTWERLDRKSYQKAKYHNGKRPTKLPVDWVKWRSDKYRNFPERGPKTKTTQDIVETFKYGARGDINHSIPVCRPVEMEEKKLPIDPYILGYWLGDGCSGGGHIACHEDDQENLIKSIVKSGYKLGKNSDPIMVSVLGLSTQLRKIGSINKESIPESYRTGSIQQRLDLLRGLMDSDGFCHEKNGTIEFSQSRRWISELVYELAASLGQKPRIATNKSWLYGVEKQNRHRVIWRPTFGINPFRLKRKSDRIKPDGNQSLRNYHRMISGFEQIDPVPMRCLTVDSPNSMFLVGKNYIPTHNSRTGSEWVRQCVEEYGCRNIGLVGATAADVLDVMCNGISGIVTISPPWNKPKLIGIRRVLIWPNGAEAHFYSAEQPERLRGPQHDAVWADEFGAYGRKAEETYNQIQFGLRLNSANGHEPKLLITTTPRPIERLKKIIKKHEDNPEGSKILIVKGTSHENRSNLADNFFEILEEEYAGTRLGRQEIDGEMLGDHVGALWNDELLDKCTSNMVEGETSFDYVNRMVRIVVGVDPSGGDGKNKSDEQGIVVAGIDKDGIYWVLDDVSCAESPLGWAKIVLNASEAYKADKIIAEKNFGGELVRQNIKSVDDDSNVHLIHASKSKQARAEPIANLYQQGKVRHIREFKELETQMKDMTTSGYQGSGSPDRVDALVWCLSELKGGQSNRLKYNVRIRAH